MYWMMGGFGGVDWQQLWLMLALLPVLLWVCWQSQPLNLLALGEVSARQLGLPLWLWRKLLVVATGWRSASAWRWRGDWLYWSGDPAYFAPVRPERSSGAASRLPVSWRQRAARRRYHRPAGVIGGGITDRRGDGDAGAPVFIWLLLRSGRRGRDAVSMDGVGDAYQPLMASPL